MTEKLEKNTSEVEGRTEISIVVDDPYWNDDDYRASLKEDEDPDEDDIGRGRTEYEAIEMLGRKLKLSRDLIPDYDIDIPSAHNQIYSDEMFVEAVELYSPASTKEVQEYVGSSRRSTIERLRKLAEHDVIESKKVGETIIWYLRL